MIGRRRANPPRPVLLYTFIVGGPAPVPRPQVDISGQGKRYGRGLRFVCGVVFTPKVLQKPTVPPLALRTARGEALDLLLAAERNAGAHLVKKLGHPGELAGLEFAHNVMSA